VPGLQQELLSLLAATAADVAIASELSAAAASCICAQHRQGTQAIVTPKSHCPFPFDDIIPFNRADLNT
jgi:hypothetical protein